MYPIYCSNKLKEGGPNSNKDWFDSSDSMMSDRTGATKSDSDHYSGYQGPNQMPPHHPLVGPEGHDASPLNPQQHMAAPQHAGNLGYSPQQQQAPVGGDMQSSQHPPYPNYPGMGGSMSPMSPGYQNSARNPPPPHHQQQQPYQYGGDQYGQMGMQPQPYSGQGCHMGGPQGMPHGPPGREGDPYSFVDEYTGPSPRPVDEVLGNQLPKRRGRKPKHIKLMENGLVYYLRTLLLI